MELGVPDFVKQYGSAELKADFEALSEARPGSPLYEEFVDFMSHGKMGAQETGCGGVATWGAGRQRPGRARGHGSDNEVQRGHGAGARVQDAFHTEVIKRMIGPKGPVVRGYDVNTALGRRIEF
jgi:hypothetical protein